MVLVQVYEKCIFKLSMKEIHCNMFPLLILDQRENVPPINKDVWGLESLTVTVHRGEHGYGFSVVESCPVKVGRVDRGQYFIRFLELKRTSCVFRDEIKRSL